MILDPPTLQRDSAELADTAALANVLRPAILRLSRILRREMETVGMSPLQALLLALIEHNPGIGVGELARREGLRGPTVSGHVKQLEAAGLVARTAPCADDRRRVGLQVTAEGAARLTRLRHQRSSWLAGEIDKLSPPARAALAAAVVPLQQIGGGDDLNRR